MKKPIIGIIGRPDISTDGYPTIYVYENARKAVVRCGANPILILPTKILDYETTPSKDIGPLTEEDKEMLTDILNLCDGIIMPGGLKWYDHDRFICDYAIRNDKPLFGICLGAQAMACYNTEYSLEKNDENGLNHSQKDIKYAHTVNIVDNTKLKELLGNISTMEVNTRHDYHITKANDFIISAYSSDGLIEAIEYPNKKFIIGVQWHPELMTAYDEINKRLFTKFIDICKK